MDKGKEKDRFAWMPALMPGVAALMKTKRAEVGDAHVAECWRRGMAGEAGWFFAWEGALAIGTPFDRAMLEQWIDMPGGSRKAMVLMRNKEVRDGADR